jgi:transcriptional regulator
MYSLPVFIEHDATVVRQFMEQHPFITLCGCDADGRPVATHVPVFLKERENKLYIYGHIKRKTDHHKAFLANPKVLAIFSGPHTYVSASWYKNPQQGSTWNYITVHAQGIIHLLDEHELTDILKELTFRFENNEHSPSLFEKLPEAYVAQMSKAIVGFAVEVTKLDNLFKLSQNRERDDYYTVIEKLEQQGGDAGLIAAEMKKRAAGLYTEKPVINQSSGHE